MKKLVFGFISLGLLSCQPEVKQAETKIISDTISTQQPDSVSVEVIKKSKLLIKASFTEPFMYAEIFTNRAVFTFPEKDSLVLKHDFDSLAVSKDFSFIGTDGLNSFKLELTNKACTHPGSGEKWPIQAKFVINGISYQGCAK